jgi:hypothetical protein
MAISTEECNAHYDRLLEISNALDVDGKTKESLLMSAQIEFQESYEKSDNISTECRQLQFRSLSAVDWFVRSEASLTMLRSALSTIEALGVANEQNRVDFFKALVGHRRFDEARAFKLKHPTLEVERIPEIAETDIHMPAAFRIADASGDRLVPVSFELDKIRLVAVVHPLCSFSKRALTAIASAQPGMASSRAVYLAPVDQMLFLSELIEWNGANDSVEILLANSREDWPFIDRWATPSFYILRDGQVQATLSGWPDDSQLEKLIRLIESAD